MMSDAQPVFIGIDATVGKRPATIAILNTALRILHCGDVSTTDLVDVIAEYPNAVCGVDAPIEHSRSLLADRSIRQRFGLDPKLKNYNTYRVCEYELRRRGIHSYKTPVERQKAPSWMQESWRLYDRLHEAGFVIYPNIGSRVMFETYPHAAYTMLLKHRPFAKDTLEGRIQRQLILYKEGVEVSDPMLVFEEWTRHQFLTGQLRTDNLFDHDALDALAAAYTAFLVYREPQNVTAIGESLDGQIVVPVPSRDLLEVYS
jgi:predicted nuclease with RNAse H fold